MNRSLLLVYQGLIGLSDTFTGALLIIAPELTLGFMRLHARSGIGRLEEREVRWLAIEPKQVAGRQIALDRVGVGGKGRDSHRICQRCQLASLREADSHRRAASQAEQGRA